MMPKFWYVGSLSFFFSSRRRHTRSLRDWSSDVCSSDLVLLLRVDPASSREQYRWMERFVASVSEPVLRERLLVAIDGKRSEERRVGKECRSRWSPDE